jgi:MFS family permease
MVLTGVSMIGQIAGGFLGDRFSKRYLAAGTLVGHCTALLLLATADGYMLVLISAAIQGMAWGVRTPVLISMRGDYFGRKSFAMIMGFSQVVMMLGMVVGPLLSGYFADNYSYGLGFKIIAVATAPGILLFVFLRNPQSGKPALKR